MHFSYYRRPVFLLLLLYSAVIIVFKGYFLGPSAELPFPLPRAGVLVEGRVAEYPIGRPGGRRFTLETSALYGRPFKTGLMVYSSEKSGFSYGDRVSFLADLGRAPGAAAPGSLDWADYLGKRGIAAEARAMKIEVTGEAGPVLRLARAFRLNTLETFDANLGPEAASVLGGVVLGEKRNVPPELKLAFQDSGAMHLLVASGSNVGFVVAVVYFFCFRLGFKRRASGLAALALSGFYVLASGLDPPLVRAYLMFSAGLCAYLLRREGGAFQALCLAALGILVFSPRALFDAGFQMSFLAAYGLIVGMALWGRYFKAGGLPGKAAALLRMSFFAQLGLYPLLAIYFHKISLVSLFSNMLLVPGSGVAMALGFLLAFFSKAGFILKLLVPVAGLFMKLFIGTVRFFAAMPYSSVYVAQPSALGAAGFYVCALAFLHAPLSGFRNPRLLAAAALGAAVMAAGALGRAVPAGNKGVALLFGDSDTSCVLVKVPGAGLFMVNPGLVGKKLADAVLAEGGRELEGVLLTSLEKKNYSGLEELAGMVAVKNIFIPYGPQPPGFSGLLRGLEEKGAAVRRAWPGEAPAAALKVAAGWGGRVAGYTGRGDLVDWDIYGLSVEKDGGSAVQGQPGAEQRSAVLRKGGVTVLEFSPAGERGATGQAKLVSYPI